MKYTAFYESKWDYDIPDEAYTVVLKDEEIELAYGNNKELLYKVRRVAYGMMKLDGYLLFATNNLIFMQTKYP